MKYNATIGIMIVLMIVGFVAGLDVGTPTGAPLLYAVGLALAVYYCFALAQLFAINNTLKQLKGEVANEILKELGELKLQARLTRQG